MSQRLVPFLLLGASSGLRVPPTAVAPVGAGAVVSHAASAAEPLGLARTRGEVGARAPALLDSFLEHFHGRFDNAAQVRANEAAGLTPRHGGGHEHIACQLREVAVEGAAMARPGQAHVLASYYFNGQPEAVFRERLYAIDAVDDPQFGACVRMSIYRLRGAVADRIRAAGGLHDTPEPDVRLAEDDLAEELHVSGADVYWRWCGERFEGRMRADSITIVSERSGRPIRVRDDVALWADALWVNDRGCDAETGEYVYGNIHDVPYKLQRMPDPHPDLSDRR